MTPEVAKKIENNRFKSAEEGLNKVCTTYEGVGGKLTEISQQVCLLLIGANWVIFGHNTDGLLADPYAKYSVASPIVALCIHFSGAWFLTETLRRQNNYGEQNPDLWEREYRKYRTCGGAWPFTGLIENGGICIRAGRGIFILLSGILLIVGVFLKRPHTPSAAR